MTKLSFNIIGAGSIGHLWQCFLQQKGFQSRLYTRATKPSQIISIESPLGNFSQSVNYQTIDLWQQADVILICVKAHQLESLCEQLKKREIQAQSIVLMMNGLGLIEIVEDYWPDKSIIQANITHGVYLTNSQLVHAGLGETWLGDFGHNHPSSNSEKITTQLNQALPKVSWDNNHKQRLLLKLITNAIINPITALNNQPNDFLLMPNRSLDNQSNLNLSLIPQAEALLEEMCPLLNKLLPTLNFETIRQAIIQVAWLTRENISSMLQDIRAERPTEIDFINGYLAKKAESYQLTLPENEKIIHKIKNLTQ